jgi:dienelactone hydrolase
VKAQLLVMTGGADPFVPAEQVAAFEKEMKDAGVRFQVIRYPGAKHGFTNPDAGTYGMPQLEYDAAADAKSWEAMLKFFKKTLK